MPEELVRFNRGEISHETVTHELSPHLSLLATPLGRNPFNDGYPLESIAKSTHPLQLGSLRERG